MTRLRTSTTIRRLLALATVALLLPSGASAACSGAWNLSDLWYFHQDNDYSPSFELIQ